MSTQELAGGRGTTVGGDIPRRHHPYVGGVRWRKVARDLWLQKSRSVLAVLSISIGIFAIAVLLGTQHILQRDLADAFAAINPSNATIQSLAPLDKDLVDSIKKIPGVVDAEGRHTVFARARVGNGEWDNIQLIAVPDYNDVRIDKFARDTGPWPPPEHQLLVERSGLRLLDTGVGGTLTVRTPGGKERDLPIVGTAHDLYALLYTLDGVPWAFVTEDTLEWLGEPPGINEIRIQVDKSLLSDRANVTEIARQARNKVEDSGGAVFLMSIPEPGKHPLDSIIRSLLILLAAMGVLSLLLGGLLVTNTVGAILAEETRAIGVMKTIGARRRDLVGLYAAFVFALGLAALVVALPLSVLGTYAFATMMGRVLNFDVTSLRPPLSAFLAATALGLAIPVLAAMAPILKGTRITVREAIGSYGLGRGVFGTGRLDRLLRRLPHLPRPFLLSLRNTFRRKVRLVLTLTTLTMASAIFIAVFSVRASANATLDTALKVWGYDVLIEFSHPYRADQLVELAMSTPGVAAAEPWSFESAHWANETGNAGLYYGFVLPVVVFAPPADTKLLNPALSSGRWLLPSDERAIVINTGVLKDKPNTKVGDTLRLKVGRHEQAYTVVGILRDIGIAPIVYVNYGPFARSIDQTGRAGTIAVKTAGGDAASQDAVAEALEAKLSAAGYRVSVTSKIAQERSEVEQIIEAIVLLLLGMAMLLAGVGALALTGAMSLGVIERTREIGVMRAIGASSGAIARIFVGEAVVIGVLSWMFGVVVALPLSKVLSEQVGLALMTVPFQFKFATAGALAWLGAVVVTAIVASLLPARRATRVTVREALSYE